MPEFHFNPPTNDKRTMNEGDPSGWYQVTIIGDGKFVAICRWWNGREWNHGPNMRRGWNTGELGDVRGIVHLVES